MPGRDVGDVGDGVPVCLSFPCARHATTCVFVYSCGHHAAHVYEYARVPMQQQQQQQRQQPMGVRRASLHGSAAGHSGGAARSAQLVSQVVSLADAASVGSGGGTSHPAVGVTGYSAATVPEGPIRAAALAAAPAREAPAAPAFEEAEGEGAASAARSQVYRPSGGVPAAAPGVCAPRATATPEEGAVDEGTVWQAAPPAAAAPTAQSSAWGAVSEPQSPAVVVGACGAPATPVGAAADATAAMVVAGAAAADGWDGEGGIGGEPRGPSLLLRSRHQQQQSVAAGREPLDRSSSTRDSPGRGGAAGTDDAARVAAAVRGAPLDALEAALAAAAVSFAAAMSWHGGGGGLEGAARAVLTEVTLLERELRARRAPGLWSCAVM